MNLTSLDCIQLALKKKIQVGILSNEFLDSEIGRMGGFGWAAKRAIETLRSCSAIRDVAVFAGERALSERVAKVHGAAFIDLPRRRYTRLIRGMQRRPDVILSIDFRPSYLRWIKALPGVPIIVWVRDPRTPDDWERIESLRFPDDDTRPVGGTERIDCFQLARYSADHRFAQGRILFASKMRYLEEKVEATYGLPPTGNILPNPDVVNYSKVVVKKHDHPKVAFLGRLDPIKRPWLVVELARRFPGVEFVMMGQNHFTNDKGWRPSNVPENVKFVGHLEGEHKFEVLSSAWLLLNTSIHEESPVSVFEALAYETPVISTVDSDRIVADHGVFVGRFESHGLSAIPALSEALEGLLQNTERRLELGVLGRRYVQSTHNDHGFLAGFAAACRAVGVRGLA